MFFLNQESVQILVSKAVKHADDSDTNCSWHIWNNPWKARKKKISGIGIRGENQDHNIIKISWNTQKNLKDLLSLRLQWKTPN